MFRVLFLTAQNQNVKRPTSKPDFFLYCKWGGLVQLKKNSLYIHEYYSSVNKPLTNFVSFQEENVDLIIGKISTSFQLHTTMKHETQTL